MKRFEDEFTDRSIHLYTRDFPLESFHAKNQRGNEAKKTCIEYYIKAI